MAYRLTTAYVKAFNPTAFGWTAGSVPDGTDGHQAFLEALSGTGKVCTWTRGSLTVTLLMEYDDQLHAAYINGHVVDIDAALEALETPEVRDTTDLFEGSEVLYLGLPAEIVNVPDQFRVELCWNHIQGRFPFSVGLHDVGRAGLDGITLLRY